MLKVLLILLLIDFLIGVSAVCVGLYALSISTINMYASKIGDEVRAKREQRAETTIKYMFILTVISVITLLILSILLCVFN